MTKLTKELRDELFALAETCNVVGRSFIWRPHWHMSGYRTLVRKGLVEWSDPPAGFDRRKFAGVAITEAGRSALKGEAHE